MSGVVTVRRLVLALAFVVVSVSSGTVLAQSRFHSQVQPRSHSQIQIQPPLGEGAVVARFQKEGLPVGNLHSEAVAGAPGGPPMTETAAWRFTIPEVAPSGGKIMIFPTAAAAEQKAAWFHQVQTRYFFLHKNVILWLDPGVSAAHVTAYRASLLGL